MNTLRTPRRIALSPGAILFTLLALPLQAQVAPESDSSSRSREEEPVRLDIFNVTAESDSGYLGRNSLSGTRLNTSLKDLPAPITIVTKELLRDTAAVDINDIFLHTANTEGSYQYTAFENDRGNIVDTVALTPHAANRVRGMGRANVAVGNFASTGSIPVDTYNLEAVEVSRGPNSNIFGLGAAAGTINLITAKANTQREINSVSVRFDNNSSRRGTVDFNRPLGSKFAVRFSGAYDDQRFEQKPARDKTERYTIAVTAKPFKRTTLNLSFESYDNVLTRPNSSTPRDTTGFWRDAGSPVWNPVTSSWRYLDSDVYTVVPQNQESTSLPLGINQEFSNFFNRPSWFLDQGELKLWMPNRGSNASGFPNVSGNLRFVQTGTVLMRGGGTYVMPDGSSQSFVGTPLFQQPGTTDSSVYDWTSVNLAAPNFSTKKAETIRIELEQWFLESERHLLALQAGFFREDIDQMSRSFIGASDGAPPIIRVDVNEYLLDGTPNPFFLRPYIGGSEMQINRRPEENDNYRATLAYQIDFSNEKSWLKHLGRHRFAAYGEYRELINVPNGHRSRDIVVSDNSWMSPANLTNVPGRGPENRIYTRYYMGGSVNEGSVVDYAPQRPNNVNGPHTIRYFDGTTWVNEEARLGEVHFSTQNLQLRQVRTLGAVWQGFFLDDKIVPTFGVRKDKLRNRRADPDVMVDPDRGIFAPSYTFDTDEWVENSGRTTTKGIVVHPFHWLSLHYNESDSFLPETTAYDLFQNRLNNPEGKGRDYGVTFTFFDGKFIARLNKYRTTEQFSRSGATNGLMNRAPRLDFHTGPVENVADHLTAGDSRSIQRSFFNYVTTLHPTWSPEQVLDEVWAKYMGPGLTPEYVEWFRSGVPIADVNTVTSNGLEIELNYNPNRFWTMAATITQQEAIDTDLSPNIQKYIDMRWEWWQTLRIPTDFYTDPISGQQVQLENAGELWWTSAPGDPEGFYTGSVGGPYRLAVTNAGKPRSQMREWRVSFNTRYELAALGFDNWLKNIDIGGSARWEDKATIGFMGKAPEADGVIRDLDGNKPIYDSARTYINLMLAYKFRFGEKISGRVQLNVNNVFEDGRLQAVAANPDGTPWNYRIIHPRQFLVTTTFDF